MKKYFWCFVETSKSCRMFVMRHNKPHRVIPYKVFFTLPYKSGVFSVVIRLVRWVVSQQRRDALLSFFGITKTMRHNPKTIDSPRQAAEISTATARKTVNPSLRFINFQLSAQ